MEQLLSDGLSLLGIDRLLMKESLVSGLSGGNPSFGVQAYDTGDIARPASAHLLDNAACY
jgi:hypothetical protein